MSIDVSPLLPQGVPLIQSYKNRVFKILGTTYDHDIILSQAGVIPWMGDFDHLPAHDVLIWGTGDTQIWPAPQLRARFRLEVMTTPAACRTYNALIGDGRAVIAILQLCDG